MEHSHMDNVSAAVLDQPDELHVNVDSRQRARASGTKQTKRMNNHEQA